MTAAHPTYNRALFTDDEANRQIGRGELAVNRWRGCHDYSRVEIASERAVICGDHCTVSHLQAEK